MTPGRTRVADEEARPYIRLLGPPRIELPGRGQPVPLERMLAALFAFIAIDGPQPSERVADLLYEGAATQSRRGNLRQRRKDLRSALGRDFLIVGDTLSLAPDVVHDLTPFPPPAALEAPGRMPTLLEGCAYPDRPALDGWLSGKREWMAAAFRRMGDDLVLRLQAEGRLDAAVERAEWMIASDPGAELGYLRLARLHRARGDLDRARDALRRGREMVARLYEAAPSQEFVDQETLLQPRPVVIHRTAADLPSAWLRHPAQVGRESELRAMRRAWRDGRILIVEGEPGIGKSALIDRLCREHRSAVRVAAVAGDAMRAHGLLRRLLLALGAGLLETLPGACRAELARILPQLGPEAQRPAYAPRLAEAVRQALAAAQAAGRTGLVLDDVQWADGASLEVLMQAAEWAEPKDFLWCFACRIAQAPQAFSGWPLRQEPSRSVVVTLRPLPLEAVAALLAKFGFEGERSRRAWAKALVDKGLGNPLHLRQLLDAIEDRDGPQALRAADPTPSAWPAPEGQLALVQHQLRRLSESATRLAWVAALAESELSARLAGAVADLTAFALANAWRELESTNVLTTEGRFTHDLIRESVRASLPDMVASSLHARIAQHAGQQGTPPARVGFHWAKADRPDLAAAWYSRAADEAAAGNLLREELEWRSAASAQFAEMGRSDECFRVLCKGSNAAEAVLPQSEAMAWFESLAGLAREPEQVCIAQTLLTYAHQAMGDAVGALDAANRAQRMLAECSAARLASWADFQPIDVEIALASAMSLAGDPRGAIERLLACRHRLPRDEMSQRSAAFYSALAVGYSYAGELPRSAETFREVIRQWDELGDWVQSAAHSTNYSGALHRLGDMVEACRVGERAGVLLRRLGALSGNGVAHHHRSLGGIYRALGRYQESIAAFEKALDLFDAGRAASVAAVCSCQLAEGSIDLGDLDRAATLLQPEPPPEARAIWLICRARLAAAAGEDVSAVLASAAHLGSWVHFDYRLALSLMQKDLQTSEAAAREAMQLCAQAEEVGCTGIAQHARFVAVDLLRRSGNPSAAVEILDIALTDIDSRRPVFMYWGRVWLIAHEALREAGRAQESDRALSTGVQWVLETALANVPAPLRFAFVERNAINRSLLRLAGRSVTA